ncbi:CFA70 protein, partial [Chaetorhynchus papuensis]|nr:CFA70 protein [Chaetorhynchus papuensis]
KSLKSNVLVTLVRVEYNGAVLGDSPKTDVLLNGTAEYNFSTSFECSPDGPNSLDVIVQKPLLLTVLEVGPKEKKKPEKITPIGQAVVDLLPLLQGVLSLKVFAPLYAVPASSSEKLHPKATGGLEVIVSSKELLLSVTQYSSGNLLSITMEAAYAVPGVFTIESQQNYMACLQIPAAGEKDLLLLFQNGILKADGEKEPLPRPKNWPLGAILAPGALTIPNSFIVGGPYEDEDGELTRSKDREFRTQAESAKRIVWDTERRCYLDAAAVAVLQKRIAECRYWPVELCKVSFASGGKGKTSKVDKGDEDKQIAFHGVAYVNMMHLLCPGVKQIRGAFRVFSYQDSEVFEKTKVQHSIFRDLRSQLSLVKEGLGTSPVSRAPPTKGQKEDKDSSATVRSGEAHGTHWLQTARPREQCLSPQYSEAGTFLVMEIKLDRPLVPKRLREELVGRVKDMVSPQPAVSPWPGGANKAVKDYEKCITNVAVAILREYHELFGKQLPHQGVIDHGTLEEQRRQLNYELNTSGKYFAFKEQIKHSVVKIVREKYLKTTAFESQQQLQEFLSHLYMYLVDQMHVALNKFLSGEDVSAAPPTCTTEKQLWLFAREAEANRDFEMASLFYKQRIAQDQCSIQAWLDYGAFCLLRENATKAQECFKQALCLDPQHTQSLLLCGIVSVQLQHYEEAEIFFEDACCLEPSSIIAWTLSGLFYELQNNYIRAERNFREAKRLLRAAEAEGKKPSTAPGNRQTQEGLTPARRGLELCGERWESRGEFLRGELQRVKVEDVDCELEQNSMEAPPLPPPGFCSMLQGFFCPHWDVRPCFGFRNKTPTLGLTETHFLAAPCPLPGPQPPPCTIFMKAVEFLMKVNAVRFVHKALAHELLSLQGGPTCAYYLALAWTYLLKEDLPRCEECLCEAIRIDPMNPNVWAQKGHLCYLKKRFDKAKDCYERVISFVEDAMDMHIVYLRLGSIYLEEKEYGRAKQIYLLACDDSASCLTWLGVGIACYRLNEMVEAEDALSEANALNNTNAEVWGYLALVCLQGGRQLEAEQCYKYTIKLGLKDSELLREIRATQLRVGFGDPSL